MHENPIDCRSYEGGFILAIIIILFVLFVISGIYGWVSRVTNAAILSMRPGKFPPY